MSYRNDQSKKSSATFDQASTLVAVVELSRVDVKSITLAPAQWTGLYLHPCTVVGYVPEVAISFRIEGQPLKVLKQGDAFHEAPRRLHP